MGPCLRPHSKLVSDNQEEAMCKLFIQADSKLWHSSTRSVRIDGMVTSVRLENYFWSTLEEIATRDDMNIPQMLTRLYHESIDAGHDLGNFTSFLRVCCMRYLALQLSGEIPRRTDIAIASLDADQILSRESRELH
jgi:predicted DNA-binding ribbon-helix-helix protein